MRDETAAELATLLIQERRLLREDVPAQFRRYGKPLREGLTIDADALERELREFTRRPYRAAPPPPPARPPGPMRRLPRASPLEPLRHSLSLPAEGCAEPGTTEQRIVAVGAPETIGYEGRAYVAESIAFNSELLFEAGVPHTSIVAGIWEILSWNLAKETRTCTADLSWVIDVQSPLPPQMQHVFLDWVLANGCAGEYPDDANLLLVLKAADFGDHSYETTLRYLRGTSDDTAGQLCRARFGAVPKGYYGVHYVCHQACNAFASVKWGIIPVNEWYSELVFGETGKLGVSDTEHPCYCPASLPLWVATGLSASDGYNGGDCEACAVDKGCCWVDAWGDGSGHAYGVEYGWDHIQGQWVDAGFRFDSEEPPLDGHQFDDPPPSFSWADYQ